MCQNDSPIERYEKEVEAIERAIYGVLRITDTTEIADIAALLKISIMICNACSDSHDYEDLTKLMHHLDQADSLIQSHARKLLQ